MNHTMYNSNINDLQKENTIQDNQKKFNKTTMNYNFKDKEEYNPLLSPQLH